MKFCLCDCGNQVSNLSNRYILGHNRRGMKWTDNQREKIPCHKKLKGRKLSLEHKQKISIGLKTHYASTSHPGSKLKGCSLSVEMRKKISLGLKGRKISETAKEKLRIANLGKKLSLETRIKMSNSRKGTLNPFYGKHHSEETKLHLKEVCGKPQSLEARQKISKANTGRKFPEEFRKKCSLAKLGNKSRLGIPHTEETKRKISEAQLGKIIPPEVCQKMSKTMKAKWSSPDYIMFQMRVRGIRPNKSESWLDSFLTTNFPNEWKYVGDGQIVIDRMVPDWININGKKQVIELYGDYWHKGQDPQDRIDKFAEFGFDCLVIWEHELKEKTEQELVGVIKEFNQE